MKKKCEGGANLVRPIYIDYLQALSIGGVKVVQSIHSIIYARTWVNGIRSLELVRLQHLFKDDRPQRFRQALFPFAIDCTNAGSASPFNSHAGFLHTRSAFVNSSHWSS